MAMNQTTAGYSLPCGRDVEAVWDRLDNVDADHPDEHQQSCPHCRVTRGSLQVLREVTGHLVEHPVEPSEGLLGRIMSAVRAEVRRHDMLPLPTAEPGSALISEQAAAAVLRFAADSVEGVRARSCRISHIIDIDDRVQATDGVGAVAVELSIAVSYPNFAAGNLQMVWERVSAAVAAGIGVRLVHLDVIVADVYDA